MYYRAVVNGAHRDGDLQTHMHRYIENFVLCKNCRLPETHYKIKEGLVRISMRVGALTNYSRFNMYVCMCEQISQKCLACGHKESVDMTHKLTAFILAQHKKSKEASKVYTTP
jgi:translation initiation factor 5